MPCALFDVWTTFTPRLAFIYEDLCLKTKVTIQFQTPQDFTRFRSLVDNKILEKDIVNLRITCECGPEDIAYAMNYLGARVIHEH